MRRELMWYTPRADLLHCFHSARAGVVRQQPVIIADWAGNIKNANPHLPGMLSEGWSNEILAARGEPNDTNPRGVLGAEPEELGSIELSLKRIGKRAAALMEQRN